MSDVPKAKIKIGLVYGFPTDPIFSADPKLFFSLKNQQTKKLEADDIRDTNSPPTL